VRGTAPICTKFGLGLQLFVKNSTPRMKFMKIRCTFLLADNYVTDRPTSSSHTAFFLSFLLRKERLTFLYLRLRVMCSEGCEPVTLHTEVAPHRVQPFVAMYVRILPAACLFVCGFLLFCYPCFSHRAYSCWLPEGG
jgi:hypothetical protein